MNFDNKLMPLSTLDLSKLLEVCVDRLNDAIVITEAEPINEPGPRIVWANKVFYEHNGYCSEEIIGQSPRILHGPNTDRSTLDRVRHAIEHWQSTRVEILNYRKDGTTYWNEFDITPIANEKGLYTHWVSVQRDVTERKQAEQILIDSEAHFRLILESSPTAVRITSMATGLVKFANQYYAKMTNCALDAVIGLDAKIYYANPQDYVDVLESLNNGDHVTNKLIEIINFTEPTKPKWTLATYMLITFDNESAMLGWFYDITEQKQAENYEQFRSSTLELLGSMHKLPYILEAIVLGIEKLDSKMLCSILLLDKEGKHLCSGIAPSLPSFYNAALDGIGIGIGLGSCGTAAFTGERVIVEDVQSHPYWASYKELAASAGLGSCWSQPIRSAAGKVLGTFAIYHHEVNTPTENDIHLIEQFANLTSIAIERKQAEAELKVGATVFESQEGMMVTDANNIILRVNHAFTKITGYSADEAIGQTPKLLSSGRQSKAFYDVMWDKVNNAGAWEGELWNRRKSGEVYPQHLTITAVNEAMGIVTNYVATLTDITLSKAASDEIRNLAFYDPLTGLPNRRLLLDRLKQAMASVTRSSQSGALFFLDLDHFKTLNDTLGHDVGDYLLQQVARRLIECVRGEDTIARLGGDEFVVLLEDLNAHPIEAALQAEKIGEKILSSLNQTYQLGEHIHHSTPSIGVTLFNAHSQSIDELLKQADIAMYQAKKNGRNTLSFFDPDMQVVINN